MWCYDLTAMKNLNTVKYSTPIQLKIPVDMERIIEISDPVYTFSEVMEHIDLRKYVAERKDCSTGRPKYAPEKLLKVILFAFMEFGYCSVRMIEKLCKTDIRFLWLLDEENAPSHMTISSFIKNELMGSVDEIFSDINGYGNTAQIAYRESHSKLVCRAASIIPSVRLAGRINSGCQAGPVSQDQVRQSEQHIQFSGLLPQAPVPCLSVSEPTLDDRKYVFHFSANG